MSRAEIIGTLNAMIWDYKDSARMYEDGSVEQSECRAEARVLETVVQMLLNDKFAKEVRDIYLPEN